MTLLTVLNAATNLINVGTIAAIVVFVYGREDSPVYKDPLRALAGKVGLCTLMAGSCFSLLTFSTPVWSEVLRNFGVSCIFLLGAHWHYSEFIRPHERPAGPPKKTPRPPRKRRANG